MFVTSFLCYAMLCYAMLLEQYIGGGAMGDARKYGFDRCYEGK